MELNKKIQINILSIKNPGKFWFRTLNESKRIQAALSSYLKKCDVAENCDFPEKDRMIIVKANNIYSIARVEKVVNETKIKVSRLENGHTSWVPSHNIIPLNDQNLADTVINSILMGSIKGVSPAQQVHIVVKTYFLEKKTCARLVLNLNCWCANISPGLYIGDIFSIKQIQKSFNFEQICMVKWLLISFIVYLEVLFIVQFGEIAELSLLTQSNKQYDI